MPPVRDIDSLPGDPRFKDKIWEILLLHAKKQSDYGSDEDPFANVRAAEEFGIPAFKGVFIRMNDKFKRLKSFSKKGNLLNESVHDSLKDLSVYGLIADILIDEVEAKNPSVKPILGVVSSDPRADHTDYDGPPLADPFKGQGGPR